MDAPLSGTRVVEVAHWVAVPAAGALLADLGAEVVKVELPGGEVYRHGRPRYSGYDCDFPESPAFHMDNKGKRSLVLDLAKPEARAALLRMIERADIFITNLLPARREKFGLDHESLLARHPRLVVGGISGYGHGGDRENWPAFDYSTYWARTGMMDTMRDEGVPPSMQRPAVGDHAAAVNLVCGLLAALRLRDASGKGQYVDVSLLQTGLHILGTDVANALVTRQPARRHDRRGTQNPLWNSYPVAGDRWLLLVMIQPDRYWPRLCEAIGRPDLLSDPRFEDAWKRLANCRELIATLEDTFAQRTLEEWGPVLDAAGVIWAPVNRVEEAVEDPEARALGYFYEVEHATAGRFETVGPPFRIEGADLGARRAAPPLHGDAREILREAGLSEAEIEKLV
ncbi:MAG: CoA transferase [Myxococcales bacterium]|nr:CoA transferase [Myxococcales bacterium]